MAPNETGVITLVVTVAQPVNNTPNVTLANVNINVVATLNDVTDWQSLVSTIMLRGFWNGVQYYPARWISLVTAIQA